MDPMTSPQTALAADTDAASRAAEVLRAGGSVILPTETVYGVFVRADRPAAVEALRSERGLTADQRMTLQVADPASAAALAASDPGIGRFVRRALPGAWALTFDADPAALEALAPEQRTREVFSRGGRMALRCPEPSITRRVLRSVDAPVVGVPAVDSAGAQVRDLFLQDVTGGDFRVNGGPARFGRGSTAVRLSRSRAADGTRGRLRATVLRAGVYAPRIVERLNRLHILFVCTGNTCRSPMAEAFARQLAADAGGGVTVSSAGVNAADGYAASPEAVAEAGDAGGGLAGHRSHALTARAVLDADVIYTLTAAHLELLVERFPEAATKASRLDAEADVRDPIGGTADDYHAAAQQIRAAVARRLQELAP